MDPEIRREIERARTRPGEPPWQPPVANLARLLAERAAAAPERDFLVFYDDDRRIMRRWSYAETRAAVARTAGYLASLGIGRGDRVAFLIGNLDHTIVLYLATWSLGACVAPVDAAESTERKGFILDNSGSRVLFARSEYLDEARQLATERDLTVVPVDDGEDAREAYPALASRAPPIALERADFAAKGTEALLVYT